MLSRIKTGTKLNKYVIKGAVLLRTTETIQMEIFGDHGQSFCPILTKIGIPSAFMGLLMMLKGFFANINMKAKTR